MYMRCVLPVLISIHALLAESDVGLLTHNGHPLYISIHALLAESDFVYIFNGVGQLVFLSTLSLRRATQPFCTHRLHTAISIHALLAESDLELLIT